MADAEKYNIECVYPEQLTGISDKLRYYRHQKELKQSDVADFAGISRSTYLRYESGLKVYPSDKLRKIAELFEIPVTELFDEYHLFLLHGQGQQLRALRKENSLTQNAMAALLNVNTGTVKRWESDRIVMPREFWEQIIGQLHGG
jgi:transcriptional regulator with XRE-family HTH domain